MPAGFLNGAPDREDTSAVLRKALYAVKIKAVAQSYGRVAFAEKSAERIWGFEKVYRAPICG